MQGRCCTALGRRLRCQRLYGSTTAWFDSPVTPSTSSNHGCRKGSHSRWHSSIVTAGQPQEHDEEVHRSYSQVQPAAKQTNDDDGPSEEAWSSSDTDNMAGVSEQRRRLSAWVAPGSEVYANPICSQMDQTLLKCDDIEDVLALLVTHRGVFFVHNLVTAIQMLAALAEERGDKLVVHELLRDPRYDLLVRDLLRFVPKLDFLAMTNVACSLWQLDHKHYLLLRRMLRPLLKQPVPDMATLLRCAQAYAWAGYRAQNDFYTRCAQEMGAAADFLNTTQLVEACAVFGHVETYHQAFFVPAERVLLGQGLLLRQPAASSGEGATTTALSVAVADRQLRPDEVSVIAKAFAAHLRTGHDSIFDAVAQYVAVEAENMSIPLLARCAGAFRRLVLRYDAAIEASLKRTSVELERAWLLRRRIKGVRPSDVSTLLECAAYFGIQSDMTRIALQYLEDHVDEVDEASAIQIVYAMSALGCTGMLPNFLLLVFRKIGAGTSWEADKIRVFHLWVCQLLQFPWLDVRLPRRCISGGLRTWVLHRRGYGSPFPREVRQIADELQLMGVSVQTFVPVPETPYEVDLAINGRKDALLVQSELSRNTLDPVGCTLLQLRHLRSRGWRCAVVPRRLWATLQEADDEQARQTYLRSILSLFQQPGGSAVHAVTG
eukprot:TRINITY_DN69275_c0_g1_i1.p1 TRINITY_DN69275_c0_g1~~TRINITY_DN69275_c0_g1_i1.p1  ORF type:complete len:660 (-),score=101.84 TRINITY_DN69275_c0_g1_i1:90-2069(-)